MTKTCLHHHNVDNTNDDDDGGGGDGGWDDDDDDVTYLRKLAWTDSRYHNMMSVRWL